MPDTFSIKNLRNNAETDTAHYTLFDGQEINNSIASKLPQMAKPLQQQDANPFSIQAYQHRRTRDWMLIYFYDDHRQEEQQTVVSETHGNPIGRRELWGREAECGDCYRTLLTVQDREHGGSG